MLNLVKTNMECNLLELYREQDRLDELEYIRMENIKDKYTETLYLSDHDMRDDEDSECKKLLENKRKLTSKKNTLNNKKHKN